jgi:SAM-dependent methyltransferase
MWPLILLSLLAVILVISIVWPGLRGAPWVPTSLKRVRKMLDLAEVRPDDVVYDLGCGDGRTIVTAARRYGARAVGIEIDPLRYAWCQALITVLGLRDRVCIVYGDFFAQDLGDADVVTCYLLDSTNRKLQKKLLSELDPDARVVSHMFAFPELHLLHYDKQDQLYLYNPKR